MLRKFLYVLSVILVTVYLYLFGFHKPATLWTSKYRISDRKLREVSGIIFSKNNPDLMWAHNDGRSLSALFLIDKKGKTIAEFDSDIVLNDWEDIAISADKKGNSYLYAGDIGDNFKNRSFIKIIRFKEPRFYKNESPDSLKVLDTLVLKYSDGPKDAEAMFIDPLSQQLYIISKREANPQVYATALPASGSDSLILEKKGELHLRGVKILGWVTAAAISGDGTQILLRTYGKVYYWKRNPTETVEEAMKREPFDMPHVKEVQGEAICFTPENDGFYTVSEGKFPYLNHNQLK